MPKLYEALAEAFLAEGVDTQFVLEHIPLTFTCSLRERKSLHIPAG
jgi:hypothetical protein